MSKMIDKFWLWGQSPNLHAMHKVPPSRMTAAEGAAYFGLKKCCRIVMLDQPKPPFDQESIALRPMDEVIWSVLGAFGSNMQGFGDLYEVLRQADMFPNITGGMLDDFFVDKKRMEVFPPEKIARMRQIMQIGAARPLDLWVVVYEFNLDMKLEPYLEHCDVVTFWTWKSENLAKMEENYQNIVSRTPGKRHLCGCYMYDYGNNREMPLDRMQQQLDTYYRWLKEGRTDGVILCSNCCADVGFPAVELTRNWLKQIGNEEI